jgi:hypothetical protein
VLVNGDAKPNAFSFENLVAVEEEEYVYIKLAEACRAGVKRLRWLRLGLPLFSPEHIN